MITIKEFIEKYYYRYNTDKKLQYKIFKELNYTFNNFIFDPYTCKLPSLYYIAPRCNFKRFIFERWLNNDIHR